MPETLRIQAPSHLSPEVVSNVLLESVTPHAVALDVSFPFAQSVVWPTAQLHQVNVRGPYRTGIQLTDCWNADVSRCFINGDLGTEAEYANPQVMKVGIDLVGTMDAHLNQTRVTCADIGIRASTSLNGFPRCEGLHVDQGWLMHVNTGVELNGSDLGGWPTPLTTISRAHIAFNRFAVRATKIAFLHLQGINCYGSHYTQGKWAIYLVGCKKVTITDCDFWTNWASPGFFGGIVLDQCEDVEITGGTFVDSISIAMHATSSCRNVRTNGKVWDKLAAQGKVANYSSHA